MSEALWGCIGTLLLIVILAISLRGGGDDPPEGYGSQGDFS